MNREAGCLPRELTSFVDRRLVVNGVKRELSESRLVTLCGTGGVGKSRLALRVAHESHRAFADGVWMAELAKVQDPALVAHVVADALDLRDQSIRDSESVLIDYLADKHLLLVLDNCEHVIDACVHLVRSLFSAAPQLHILVTSREPLRIGAEQVSQVSPLALPGDGWETSRDGVFVFDRPARHYDALALFEDRAAAVVPGFELGPENQSEVARLCQWLDGLPLAIELAAARLRVLSLEQLLIRLENRFQLLAAGHYGTLARHQTLRATVDWSFELCTSKEQMLWARCSVFAGEFDLEAAEEICADDELNKEDVLTGVSGLVDKSILTRSGNTARTRYRMLVTLRQYGAEQLAERGEQDTLRRRHRDYYLRLARLCDAESCGPRQGACPELLTTEWPNFRAALEYCVTTPGEGIVALRLGAALWFYWVACGHVRDGRHWLGRALAVAPEPTRERARALWLDGWIAYLQGDSANSVVSLKESKRIAEDLGAETELTHALQFLGTAEMYHSNDLDRAAELMDQALLRYRQMRSWTAPALMVFARRAQVAGLLHDIDLAIALHDECRARCRELGELWAQSWSDWNRSVNWWVWGDLDRTERYARTALREKDEIGDRLGTPFVVEMLAWVAAAHRDGTRAGVLFGAVEKMWQRVGRPLFGFGTMLEWKAKLKADAVEEIGEGPFAAARRRGAAMSRRELIQFALDEQPHAPAKIGSSCSSERDTVLTKREQEVSALVADGKSNREIAADLVISQRTAESHIEHILTKLGFTSRTQIATWVIHQRGQ
jgi:non-specific serine/threonine protein kinase